MKTIRLVNESGKHIYDVNIPDDANPTRYIINGSEVWAIVAVDVYTDAEPEEKGGPRVEYVVI